MAHADIAAGAGLVLDEELLAELLAELLSEQARHDVGWAARRERHDDAHGMARIGRALGVTRSVACARDDQRREGERGAGCESTGGQAHDHPPGSVAVTGG